MGRGVGGCAQFDFHTYCLRKMTLRAYMALLRFEDTIHKHKFFFRAATSVVGCYLALHDKPALAQAAPAPPPSDPARRKGLCRVPPATFHPRPPPSPSLCALHRYMGTGPRLRHARLGVGACLTGVEYLRACVRACMEEGRERGREGGRERERERERGREGGREGER